MKRALVSRVCHIRHQMTFGDVALGLRLHERASFLPAPGVRAIWRRKFERLRADNRAVKTHFGRVRRFGAAAAAVRASR